MTGLQKQTATRYFLFSSFLCTLILVSCTNDNTEEEANPLGLPKTVSELYQDGSNIGELKGTCTYNENKLVEIYYNSSQKKVFTYSGDVISKMEYYQAGTLRFEHTYTYENDILVEYKNADFQTGNIHTIQYMHETNGTVKYNEEFSFNGSLSWTKEGTITFANDNIVEDVAEFTFVGVEDEFNVIVNVLEYDDKPNPYKSILGYSALLNLKGTIGNHNIVSDYSYISSYKNGVQYAESLTGKEYEITYDAANRPIQMDRYSNEDIGGEILYLDRIYKFTY
jgi:hypothetical protein